MRPPRSGIPQRPRFPQQGRSISSSQVPPSVSQQEPHRQLSVTVKEQSHGAGDGDTSQLDILEQDLRNAKWEPPVSIPQEVLSSPQLVEYHWPRPVMFQLVRAQCISAPSKSSIENDYIVLEQQDAEEASGRMKLVLAHGRLRITAVQILLKPKPKPGFVYVPGQKYLLSSSHNNMIYLRNSCVYLTKEDQLTYIEGSCVSELQDAYETGRRVRKNRSEAGTAPKFQAVGKRSASTWSREGFLRANEVIRGEFVKADRKIEIKAVDGPLESEQVICSPTNKLANSIIANRDNIPERPQRAPKPGRPRRGRRDDTTGLSVTHIGGRTLYGAAVVPAAETQEVKKDDGDQPFSLQDFYAPIGQSAGADMTGGNHYSGPPRRGRGGGRGRGRGRGGRRGH